VKRTFCHGLCLLALACPTWVKAQSEYHLDVIRPKQASSAGQQFLCAVPYTIPECEKQIAILQTALLRYDAEKLGRWTWVLIRSEDWKFFLTDLHLDPNSPACSHLEMRQTFFEEALLVPKPERRVELLRRWHIPFDRFLDFAVSHELGHAFCTEENEQQADRIARLLEQKKPVTCKANSDAKQKSNLHASLN
jgi:hypothetical protein